jgi:hypothetical protein
LTAPVFAPSFSRCIMASMREGLLAVRLALLGSAGGFLAVLPIGDKHTADLTETLLILSQAQAAASC